jgi:prephenate dehydrogenase
MKNRNIILIGTGLIGASFALALKLALKKAAPLTAIIGVDRNLAALEEAKSRGAIDVIGALDDIADAALVVIAIPVRQMPALFAAIKPHLSAHTIVIDVGSTKQDVVAAARAALGEKASQFVPCHPIAGREQHGPMAAESDLFVGKNVIVTSLAENSAEALSEVRALWQSLGANVIEMPAAAHDAIFAAVSHLPHMLAFALVDELASRQNAKTLFEHAASGFRDFTRIASSSPEMWRDVALNNRDALLAEMDAYLAKATKLRDALAASDDAALLQLMQRAQTAREQWLSKEFGQFNDFPLSEEAR